tara:strand:- start:29 stop:304 length:276 start_codon:yes stop_codon:yes gene_type:complete
MVAGILFKVLIFLLFIFITHMIIQHIQNKFRTPKPKLSRSLNNEKYNKMIEQIQDSNAIINDDKLFNKDHIEKLNNDLQQFMDEEISQSIS